MRKSLMLVALATIWLSGCEKSTGPTGSGSKSGDAVQQKLQELAGSGATDCGRLQSQAQDHIKPASDCALQAAQSKHPFYVAYDMPGLTVGISGDAAGKLYFVQAEQPQGSQASDNPAIQSGPCPSELRVAQSGRVTCFAPGSMGPAAHGGMPPSGTENPHGNLRQEMPNPHTGNMAVPPPKKAN